ncbi:hypothetical protein [Aeromonas hydrophila]|uniref:hypothetical protein n=1 Tax=Aeromonas hydrophila TaxID=644 RepID=UPI000F528DAF|nr:hypothetical protein [Aeromonas hydrophila]RQM69748.1 hypothetical protein EHZ82_10180 [Aeromonas hydrophila]
MKLEKLYRSAPTVKRNYPNQEWAFYTEDEHSTFIKEYETGDLVFGGLRLTTDGNFVINTEQNSIETSCADAAKAIWAVINSYVQLAPPEYFFAVVKDIGMYKFYSNFIDQAPDLRNELLPHDEYTQLYEGMIKRMNQRKERKAAKK